MLRVVLILLLLANLLFLVAGRGLFGSSTGGEPGRLAAQIDPQKIRLLPTGEPAKAPPPTGQPVPRGDGPVPDTQAPDRKATDAKAEAPQQPERCVAVAGLSGEDTLKLRDRAQDGSSWWVNLPPLPNRDAAVKRAEEVRTQGVAGAFIIREDGENRNAVSLGLFKNEAAAQEFMRQLQTKGVNGARITVRSLPGARHTLDMRGPADRVAELAELALAANSAAKREQCVSQ
jgi:hypothetical protein